MGIINEQIAGIATALSPIVHNEILEYREADERKRGLSQKGEANKQRTMPFFLENETGSYVAEIPVVSGNAMRGLMRRLLVDFSLDVLGITLGDLFAKSDDARKVLQFVRGGGLTAKGIEIKAVTAGTYERIQGAIPFLALLGGVFQGHHFEGACRIGILIPLIAETYPRYQAMIGESFGPEFSSGAGLPQLSEFGLARPVRYTRRAENEKIETADKEAMIYGTYAIPAGTRFFTYNTCSAANPGASLAFQAMFALLEQYGYVGGMASKGHGQMAFQFKYAANHPYVAIDLKKAIQSYSDHLAAQKTEIIEALQAIPKLLQSDLRKTAQAGSEE